MKAITICQPWAWLIVHGVKNVENRTWPTRHRGPLAIHAGKSRAWLKDAYRLAERIGILLPDVSGLDFGAIVGQVEVIDCVALATYQQRRQDEGRQPDPFAFGPFCHIYANAVAFDQPVKHGGSLSLWRWRGRAAGRAAAFAAGSLGTTP